MGDSGVRGIPIYCANHHCSRSVAISGDGQAAARACHAGGYDDLANAVAGAAALALGHQGVVVTSELLRRVAAMPVTRKHTAWGSRRRAALANYTIPRQQQCYPRSALPASKFEQGGESR
jgi:hypothetical protein